MMNDLISRQAAIDALYHVDEYNGRSVEAIRNLPSAQPEPIKISVDHAMTEEELKELKQKIADSPVVLLPSAEPPYNLDEWCYDCKEYDQERHCCPRFNRVIKQTKEDFEAQNEIIHCTDCRYHGTAICRIWSRYGTINVPGYGFCYRAERKEQDEGD